MSTASSDGLLRAMAEDQTEPSAATVDGLRLSAYFRASFNIFQWQFAQGRRGLLPTYTEAGLAEGIRSYFRTFRSCEGWWTSEGVRLGVPQFIEWVEEQRAKAA